jgi:hypothetical protein
MKLRLGLVAVLLLVAAVSACGSGGGNADGGRDAGAGKGGAGTSGSAGTSGGAGTSGAAGTTGDAGTTGSAGTSGAAGTTGGAGTTGAAGTGAAGMKSDGGTMDAAGAAGTTGSAGTGGVANTPVAQCQDLVKTLCNRANACQMLNATPDELAQCVRVNNVEFGCERATVSFADCASDARLVSCAGLFPATGIALPASCDDPVNSVPLSAAQQKCSDVAQLACQRSATCAGVTPTQQQLQDCWSQAFSDLTCFAVVGVSSTYNKCLTDFSAAPCGGSDAGPPDVPSCDGALIYVQ